MKQSRKWSLISGVIVALAAAAAWGISTLKGASSTIDPTRLATAERATMTRSVVATGKVEPITKIEIKSKANGIIEKLFVDVDQVVTSGQVLIELDRENLTARLREARANFQAAEAARAAAIAQLKKNGIHQLIVIGLIAHTCVETTVRYAAELGYEVTVVKDATASYSDKEMHAALEVNIPNYATAIVSAYELVETFHFTFG